MKTLYFTFVIVALDQISKILIKGINIPFFGFKHSGIKINQSIKIINDLFQLTYVENYGIAFGIDLGRNFKVAVSIFTILAVIGIFYYLFISRHKSFSIRFAIAVLLGGAIGNLIDRTFYGVFYEYAPIFHGRVVDFFHIDFFDYSLFGKYYDSFPIFNIADLSVFIGTMMLLWISFKSKKPETDEINKSETTLQEEEDKPTAQSDVINI
ncbi:MAG: signal peptidase II [Bacteroidetes bacterium]|nr:signal peptidase II [Bacteroidota bacterium]